MTAGEADVNSNIRFQSAYTVPAPQRKEEVLKLCRTTKSLKNDWNLSLPLQLMSQLTVCLCCKWEGRVEGRRRSWTKTCQIVFDASVLVRAGASFAALRLQGSSLALAFHTQQSRPVTVCRLYRQLLPYPLAPVVWPIMNIQLVWK